MRDQVLHLADLHLGAPVTPRLASLDPRLHAELQKSRDNVLTRIADWVTTAESRIALIIIAGDLFHSHEPSAALADQARLALARIHETVPVITVPGNHDEYSYASCVYRQGKWPGILATSSEPAVVWQGELESGIQVIVVAATYEAGKAQPGRIIEFPAVSGNARHIAVVHGTESSRYTGRVLEGERCFKVDSRQVGDAGYTYLALGHIHARDIWVERGCTAVYPGPPVGPSPSDAGTGRLTTVALEDSGPRVTEFDDPEVLGPRWRVEQFEVCPGETAQDVVKRLENTLPLDDQHLCALQLSGHVDGHDFTERLQELLLNGGRAVLVENRDTQVLPPRDLELLLTEDTLAGEFARAWDRWRTTEEVEDRQASLVLNEGLAALQQG